jgi:hypothetical protein
MADPVGGDTERNQAGLLADGLIGPPPRKPAAPLLPSQAARYGDVPGLMTGEEGHEFLRPAQRAVNPRLIRARQCRQDRVIADAADQLCDHGFLAIPRNHRQRGPDRFRSQIHPGRQHTTTLRPSAARTPCHVADRADLSTCQPSLATWLVAVSNRAKRPARNRMERPRGNVFTCRRAARAGS